jgi:hypothetical protein
VPPGNDPLLTDSELYCEAIAGDAGVHNAGAVWWLSPDLTVVGNAVPMVGVPVEVRLRARHRGGLPNSTQVQFDIWEGDASVAMSPTVGTTQISPTVNRLTIFPDFSSGSAEIHNPWTPATSAHRCLVGRAYPAPPAHPSPSNAFYLPTDPHYVQHNLDIVAAKSSPGKGSGSAEDPMGFDEETGWWQRPLKTLNLDEAGATSVLRVAIDRRPGFAVRQAMAPYLEALGARRVAAPLRTKVDLGFPDGVEAEVRHLDPDPEHPDDLWARHGPRLDPARPLLDRIEDLAGRAPASLSAHLRPAFDRLHRPAPLPAPIVEAHARLPEREQVDVTLRVQLDGAERGDARVYHVWQSDEHGEPRGGISVVFVLVA